MRFDSETQRLAHPHARLIPKRVWDVFFHHELSDVELELMDSNSLQNLTRVHELFLVCSNARYRLNAALCFLFAHPIAGTTLIENVTAYHFTLKELLEIFVICERPDMIQVFVTTFSETEETERLLTNSFIIACELGYLSVMEQLIGLSPNDVQIMIQAQNYEAFRAAASSGLLVVERLMALAPEEVQSMIKTQNYGPFRDAAENGLLSVMERLMEFAPDAVQAMIKASQYGAFSLAAKNGYLPVIERLMALAPNEVHNMIKADHYLAFSEATYYGHLPVMERILACTPADDVQAMLQGRYNFNSFRLAAENGHIGVINYLLQFPTVMAYAEQHEREYGDTYTHPFITQQLSFLRMQQATFELEQPHAVFNVDTNKALLYFYILRNLIRRNDIMLQDDIRFLLGIPAVKALVHTAVTPNEPNELIYLALITGNEIAAALLLTIPEVRMLAEHNNFYRDEVHSGFDLHAMVRDNESSMRALSTGEQLRLSSATTRYEPVMLAEGVEVLFLNLCEQLKARYTAHPASIQSGDGRSLNLPLAWHDWVELSQTLSADTRDRALQAYYQHKDHTALRYLSKPNPWMAENAAYVNRVEGTQSWSTFEEYKPLITMLWLAAKDTSSDIEVAPIDGYTVDTRVDRFIDELAHLGRAHNWDEQRYTMDAQGHFIMDENNNPVMEEYDDAQGDKPSCYSGVKRRLFQAVLGHPLLKFLTMDDIKQELRDEVRDYFKQHITHQNRQAIHDAWDNLCEPNPYDARMHASLNELNLPSSTQTAFIEHLSAKYPTQFNQEPEFKSYIEQRFKLDNTFPTHASRFGGETNLDGLLTLPAVTDVSSQSIFKAKLKLTPLGELGLAIIVEIQCLQRASNSQGLSVWIGSKEKLAAILIAVHTLSEVSIESLTQHLTNKQSALSQALFRSLGSNQSPDEKQLQVIQEILVSGQAQVKRTC